MVQTFIQWKGTRVCMDVYCPCGQSSHIDAEFAYFFRCPACRVVFRMGTEVTLTPATPEEIASTSAIVEPEAREE